MSAPRLIGLSAAAGASASILEFLFRAQSQPYSIENYGMLLRIFVSFTAAAILLCLAAGLLGILLSRLARLSRREGAAAGVLGGTVAVALYQLGTTFPGGSALYPYCLALAALASFAVAGWLIRGASPAHRRGLEAAWPAAAPIAGWSVIAQAFQQNSVFPGPWFVVLALLWIGGAVVIAIAAAKRPAAGHALTAAGLAAALIGALGISVRPDLAQPGPLIASSSAEAPPVILLTVDTLRRDALSLYGGTTPTPALDALGAESIVFERAYSTAPWTYVAFPSIHSGLTPWGHGVLHEGDPVPRRVSALAAVMQDHGYATGALGGNGLLAALGPLRELAAGFGDRNFYPRSLRPQTAAQRYLEQRHPDFLGTDLTPGRTSEYGAEWVRNHKSTPFLFWLHFFDPHNPYDPVEQFPPPYQPSDRLAALNPAQMENALRYGPRLPGLTQWARALYQSEVQNVDRAVGDFLQELKEQGVYDRALIIFTSDHGEEFAEHNDFYHGQTLYEELVRVPLMVKPPHFGSHLRVDQPVSTVSIMPTILDLTAVPYEPELYSAPSLRTAWQTSPAEPGSNPWPPVFMTGITQRREPAEAVVWDKYKFIRWTNADHEELYQLPSDPAERHNVLSHQPEAAALGRALLADHAKREAARAQARGFQALESAPLTPAEEGILRSLGYLQ